MNIHLREAASEGEGCLGGYEAETRDAMRRVSVIGPYADGISPPVLSPKSGRSGNGEELGRSVGNNLVIAWFVGLNEFC
jgi:hypothetical protein